MLLYNFLMFYDVHIDNYYQILSNINYIYNINLELMCLFIYHFYTK